jgi:hypothetical protein
MKSFPALAFVVTLAPVVAFGQTVQDFVIDPSPPVAPLEKAVIISPLRPSPVWFWERAMGLAVRAGFIFTNRAATSPARGR